MNNYDLLAILSPSTLIEIYGDLKEQMPRKGESLTPMQEECAKLALRIIELGIQHSGAQFIAQL